jgi:hypothetical protein
VLAFFILLGMRHVFAVPAELRANWVFQVSDRGEGVRCLAGVKKAIDFVGRRSARRAAFSLARVVLGLADGCAAPIIRHGGRVLLADVLLAGFEKFPFTCSYLPGKSNLRVSWPIYLVSPRMSRSASRWSTGCCNAPSDFFG